MKTVETQPRKILALQFVPPVKEVVALQEGETRSIGRFDLPISDIISWIPGESFEHVFNTLNPPSNGKQRKRVVFYLNNNKEADHTRPLQHERATSAYFTVDHEGNRVIVEWGLINPKTGYAKLHDYLNQHIDYKHRVDNGMRLSSGHLARMRDNRYLALLDDLPAPTDLERYSPQGLLINTLYAHNIYPICANGYVQLPAFKLTDTQRR